MPEIRTRDKVWQSALMNATMADGEVRPEKLAQEIDVSERTVRETLQVIARTPFLDREEMPDGRVRFVRGTGVAQEFER